LATYVVGDLHGQVRILEGLLEKISFSPGKDHLVAVGDVIDRGENTGDLLRFLFSGARDGWFSSVMGNHEEVLLGHLKNPKSHPLCTDPEFGGKKTLEALSRSSDKKDLIHWISSWPLFMEKSEYIIVHGGLPSVQGSRMGDTDLCSKRMEPITGYHTCLWVRPPKLCPSYDGRIVISGHSIVPQAGLVQDGIILVDTGCYRTGKLSTIRLEDRSTFEYQGYPR
jgi:serine/threonine protein phosphatase 1